MIMVEIMGLNVIDWAKQAESRGAGEIILTSIDRDGLEMDLIFNN